MANKACLFKGLSTSRVGRDQSRYQPKATLWKAEFAPFCLLLMAENSIRSKQGGSRAILRNLLKLDKSCKFPSSKHLETIHLRWVTQGSVASGTSASSSTRFALFYLFRVFLHICLEGEKLLLVMISWNLKTIYLVQLWGARTGKLRPRVRAELLCEWVGGPAKPQPGFPGAPAPPHEAAGHRGASGATAAGPWGPVTEERLETLLPCSDQSISWECVAFPGCPEAGSAWELV